MTSPLNFSIHELPIEPLDRENLSTKDEEAVMWHGS
jgi:hypothetical protein